MIFDGFISFFFRYLEMWSVQLQKSIVKRIFIDFGKLFSKWLYFFWKAHFCNLNRWGLPNSSLAWRWHVFLQNLPWRLRASNPDSCIRLGSKELLFWLFGAHSNRREPRLRNCYLEEKITLFLISQWKIAVICWGNVEDSVVFWCFWKLFWKKLIKTWKCFSN